MSKARKQNKVCPQKKKPPKTYVTFLSNGLYMRSEPLMMKPILTFLCSLLLVCPGFAKDKQPNVLFISVDDLNDWVGCLGGHPQARTPNIDRLAAWGVLFEQAYCSAPLCNPSRMATMTGLRSSTIGIWSNEGRYGRTGTFSWFRDRPESQGWVTNPQYFRQHG